MCEVKALFEFGVVAHLYGHRYAVGFSAVHCVKVSNPFHFPLSNLHQKVSILPLVTESLSYSIHSMKASFLIAKNSSILLILKTSF